MKMEARLCARPIHVSVVQWIEYRIPVPTIGVRLPTGIQKQRHDIASQYHAVVLLVGPVSIAPPRLLSSFDYAEHTEFSPAYEAV